MCAASRWIETQRADSLYSDPLGHKLAGAEGRAAPMGDWIMTPRTRFGDDLLRSCYGRGARQLVLLGAGMDARAYRMDGMPELSVFELDQKTTFDVKEPLVVDEKLSVAARRAIPTEFTERGRWAADLVKAGTTHDAPNPADAPLPPPASAAYSKPPAHSKPLLPSRLASHRHIPLSRSANTPAHTTRAIEPLCIRVARFRRLPAERVAARGAAHVPQPARHP